MLAKESRQTGTPTLTEGVTASSDNRRAPLMRTAVTEPGGFPVRGIAVPPLAATLTAERLDAGVKRALDIVLSLAALVVLAPLILAVAALVRLDSHGPAFFAVSRIGRGSRELLMLKFRKMHAGATGIALTTADDARLTRLGAFLAKSKLDELPQLWHVLRGEMSLVGPRPETHGFVARHHEEYEEILTVRPGLVGLSQIAFVAEGSILDAEDPLTHYVSTILPQKVMLDLMYARRRTLLLDLRILAWSLVAVLLRRQVAVNRESGRMNLRRR
jgi:lipopolysaccharide/colanic/teichoic acid biosynthesis glycosyltransferase